MIRRFVTFAFIGSVVFLIIIAYENQNGRSYLTTMAKFAVITLLFGMYAGSYYLTMG